MSLIALPVELHLAIFTHLAFPDLQTLRLANHYFYALIPLPTHAQLLAMEKLDFTYNKFFTCVGCTRLRPVSEFSSKMVKRKKGPQGTQAHNRFCLECGRRPLPGPHRYTSGDRWDESGVPFVRCRWCAKVAKAPADQDIELCLYCHTRALEEARGGRGIQEGAEGWEAAG
jgi:hypothetical protein